MTVWSGNYKISVSCFTLLGPSAIPPALLKPLLRPSNYLQDFSKYLRDGSQLPWIWVVSFSQLAWHFLVAIFQKWYRHHFSHADWWVLCSQLMHEFSVAHDHCLQGATRRRILSTQINHLEPSMTCKPRILSPPPWIISVFAESKLPIA